MATTYSQKVELGSSAPDFALRGVDGRLHRLSDFADKPALVVIFMCNHCPYVQAVDDRFVQLQDDYALRGVQVVGINSNDAEAYPDDSFENMRRRAAVKGYNFPYLVDDTQEVAREYGAVCTPDIYLFGPDRRLAYHGRLDDNWQDRAKVTQHDLRRAIERALAGEPPLSDQKPSMGCSIKWQSDT